MRQTQQWILDHGGLCKARNFTKYWLALIGEWPWEALPTLPPELIFIPRWCVFNLYRFASWARGTMLPLCILSARRLSRPLPPERRLDELFPNGRTPSVTKMRRKGRWTSWEGFFFAADRCLRAYQEWVPERFKPLRRTAIHCCVDWIVKHQEADGAWSGIQPPWIYSLMALQSEGFAIDHPVMRAGIEAFDSHWRHDEAEATYLQASESPVWDTVLASLALLDSGHRPDTCPELLEAARWTLNEQVTAPGDWQQFVRGVPSGGWAFEFENDAYPDVDDTAVALITLQRLEKLGARDELEGLKPAIDLGLCWMLGMQCKNGGWAAFDRDNDTKLLTKIPFADFGELLDPPSVDVTAHVLEALALSGRGPGDPVVARALGYIKSEQEADGSWFGRWGVNHIYGTAAVLPALEALGLDMQQPWIQRAAHWVADHQNADGGWGESPASYMDARQRGVGPSTASQTGWALMALLSTGEAAFERSIQLGLQWLADTQLETGTWDEPQYTGTGFPGYGIGERVQLHEGLSQELSQTTDLQRSFMINYHLYRHYFPLMALGRALSR
jgi:squalene-hopene/tetraprenyl-beta-curcumene cyclase